MFVGHPKPYPRVLALDVILLHPFQGVDTMLVAINFTGLPGDVGFGGEYVGSLWLGIVLYISDRLFILYPSFLYKYGMCVLYGNYVYLLKCISYLPFRKFQLCF